MQITITIPALAPPHGGMRVIMEWANRLSRAHQVTLSVSQGDLSCRWFELAPQVGLRRGLAAADCTIITSPHTIDWQQTGKTFIFMQMAEHLFQPANRRWSAQCRRFYTSPHPLIAISQWNIRMLRETYSRTGEIFYTGNGVNLDHFPVSHQPKDGRVVLVEGWVCYNPTKDVGRVAPQVAERLKADGYRIVAFSQLPISDYFHVPDEYYLSPDLATMNALYDRATILLKASRCDARSCSPMEAMTKGTVTARAIVDGDDDLINYDNCLRTTYAAEPLYEVARRLLTDAPLRERLADNCRQHVQRYTWDHYMRQIEQILACREST